MMVPVTDNWMQEREILLFDNRNPTVSRLMESISNFDWIKSESQQLIAAVNVSPNINRIALFALSFDPNLII
jgi:hypothetical protein